MDGRFTDSRAGGHQPATPLGHPFGLRPQGRVFDGCDLFWTIGELLRPPPGAISHKPSKLLEPAASQDNGVRLTSNSRATALSDCPEPAANTMRLHGQTC